jgi:Ca-activated chloride channel family protein
MSHLTLGAVRYALCIFLLFGLAFTTRALAADNPDELYNQGRFAEAEKGYARLDMDHPKDIRYRYNRGCAAYQNSDLQGAVAAFSSALRRAADDEIPFRATFNLGNIAFKQSDFESAVAHFKKAVVYNPASEDARYNLELALRELEKQKEANRDGQESEQPKNTDESKGEQDAQKTDNQQTGSDSQQQQKEVSEQESSQTPDQSTAEQGEQSKEPGDSRSEAARENLPRDLSGELEALNPPAEDRGEEQPLGLAPIDRKKAEALLDNIQEDRSRFLRFQVPKEKRYGVRSGKDW